MTRKFQNILKHTQESEIGLSAAELKLVDGIGQLMQFWGFKRPMGRMWTLLYLSPEPLGASELGSGLQMSSGAVSMALGELQRWGAVRKTWRPGERRELYEAETNIWKLVQRVVRERELGLVRDLSATLHAADTALREREATDPGAEFKRRRVQDLLKLAEVGERLLSALVAGKPVDPRPLAATHPPPHTRNSQENAS